MIRSQLRQTVRQFERVHLGVFPTIRHFSVSRVAAEGEGQGPSQPSGRGSSTQGASSTPVQKPRTFNRPPSNRPPGTGLPRRPRPAGAVDARSFAAPRASDQPKIIRRPRLQVTGGGKPGKGKPVKKNRGPRQPRPKRAEVDENNEAQAAAIKQIEVDQIMQNRPTPVRYEPREVDFSSLRTTWPALPTKFHGRSAAMMESLSSRASRPPDAYVPPHELAKRYLKKKYVLFESETEKAEVQKEVTRLSHFLADQVSQRKGELLEPTSDDKIECSAPRYPMRLLRKHVQGKYPTVKTDEDLPAALSDVRRNMWNNGTFWSRHKRHSLLEKVESLLASGRVRHT